LIIAEGKSALSAALTGLENFPKEERYLYGAYALTGKLKNMEKYFNTELEDKMVETKLKKVIGIDKRRYGYILLMTDSDSDGYHIRSLVINFIHVCIPDMLFNNKILILNTPLLTFDYKKISYDFFTLESFYDFRNESSFTIPNNITYMKGCGTIKKEDVKRIFKSFNDFKTTICVDKDNKENTIITLKNLFGKITTKRKEWANSKSKIDLELNSRTFKCDDYLLSCLTIYAKELNIRAIPLFNDGLKEVQRKILYSLLFKQTNKKMKLTEMASGITKDCDYLHGETSMYESIIKLTQNNITGMILFPFINADGSNGSRLCNGSDHAQARYLNVKLNNKTKYFFLKDQDKLFNYNKDELENNIEPKCLFPLIPLNFVITSKGLGFGFSHNSFSYNIKSIILYLKGETKKVDIEYNRFTGIIEINEDDINKIKLYGKYKILSKKEIQVQEIPCIDMSIEKYKKDINNKIENKKHNIKSYHVDKYSEELEINIRFNQIPSDDENIYEILNLKKSNTQILNFIFYSEEDNDNSGLIHYYDKVYNYLDMFKLNMLNNIFKLKNILINIYNEEYLILQNKINYINSVKNNRIQVNLFNNEYLDNILNKLNFKKINNSFDYLIDMSMRSLTNENIINFDKKLKKLEKDLDYIKNISSEDYYNNELDNLFNNLD
jgi:DNA topoisomerase-2